MKVKHSTNNSTTIVQRSEKGKCKFIIILLDTVHE